MQLKIDLALLFTYSLPYSTPNPAPNPTPNPTPTHLIVVTKELRANESLLSNTVHQCLDAADHLSRATGQLPQSERRLYQEDLGQQFKQVT